MPRTYTRKFDYEEARRRKAAGESVSTLAREFGVSRGAIYLAVSDEARQRAAVRLKEWVNQGQCIDCGAQITRLRKDQRSRCMTCSAIARGTTNREDELLCTDCGEWKPDDSFGKTTTKNTIARRGRRLQCRACDTKRRQDYRSRHAEAQKIYDREYQRRRRSALREAS